MLKKLLNSIFPTRVIKEKVYVYTDHEEIKRFNRIRIAEELKSLYLASPITDEDEGYNDGIDAAIQRVLRGVNESN